MSTPRQLTFEWPILPSYSADDFFVSASNQQAFDWVEAWPQWPDPVAIITGAEGVGKSHLAHIWQEKAQAHRLLSPSQAPNEWPLSELKPALLIEDLDKWVNAHEADMFHLLNTIRESRTSLLITARTQPDSWEIHTRDLLSRLRLAPILHIEAPDDALMRALLIKFFYDRQLMVDTNVVEYLATHLERSADHAYAFIKALDQEALSRGKRLTRSLVAGFLKTWEALDT